MVEEELAMYKLVKLTSGPGHHFFGFHDLEITNKQSDLLLALGVERIDRPPIENDWAEVKVMELDGDEVGREVVLTSTQNFNFPQGARQQWLADKDAIIVNETSEQGAPIANVYDARSGDVLTRIDASTYCCDATGKFSYSIDFGRLHRLGGYGHACVQDKSPEISRPTNNGIFVTEIGSNTTKLLISIAEVSEIENKSAGSVAHHFITHLRLNPSGNRLAFLHRFRLADGGEETRLMTIGINGDDCRLVGRGFLSHYDWVDDSSIVIWGRRNTLVGNIRHNPILRFAPLRALMPKAKSLLRTVLGSSSSVMQMNYLRFIDQTSSEPEPVSPDVLTEDGHPMVNPVYRDWMLSDTYPDETGKRELFLFDFRSGRKCLLAEVIEPKNTPSQPVVDGVIAHMKDRMSVSFSPEQYSFTRSGFHCDLHPRWDAAGRMAVVDANPDGDRQLYGVRVQEIVTR